MICDTVAGRGNIISYWEKSLRLVNTLAQNGSIPSNDRVEGSELESATPFKVAQSSPSIITFADFILEKSLL